MPVTLRYCDGWDWEAGEQVGWWTIADAREADREGRQYSVLVLDGETPIAVIDVAWAHNYMAVSHMDGQRRRTARSVRRRLRDDALFTTQEHRWQYEPDQRHGGDEVWHEETVRDPEGQVTVSTRRRGRDGGSSMTRGRQDVSGHWSPAPTFADTAAYAPGGAVIAEPADGQSRPTGTSPWVSPSPLTAPYLDALMTPGSTVEWPSLKETVTVTWEPAGELDLPSGRLVACDPALLSYDDTPFQDEVAPGRYPVVFAVLQRADAPDELNGYSAAAILRISDEPVVSWSMATKAGEDVRRLGDGEFFGYGVDAGMGCFFDASHIDALIDHLESGFDINEHLPGVNVVSVPGSEANLVGWQFYYGDGDYPTWIGRDAAGKIACFATDELILQG